MIDIAHCPFEPGIGTTPRRLCGRRPVEEMLETAIGRLRQHRTERFLLLEGPAGTGKSTLLRRGAEMALEEGWHHAAFVATIGADQVADLRGRLERILQELEARTRNSAAPRKLPASVVPAGGSTAAAGAPPIEVPAPDAVPHPPEPARTHLGPDLVSALMDRRTGLLLTVDEAHNLTPAALRELVELGSVVNASNPPGPVCLMLAGEQGTYASLPAVGHLERARMIDIGLLTTNASWKALVDPIRQEGADIDAEAAEHLVGWCGGWPYAIQLAGRYAWEAAAGSDRIDRDHARAGIEEAERDLGRMHEVRWSRLNIAQQHLLAALALMDASGAGSATTRQVADWFGGHASGLEADRSAIRAAGWVTGPGAANLWVRPLTGCWIRTRVADDGILSMADLAELVRSRA